MIDEPSLGTTFLSPPTKCYEGIFFPLIPDTNVSMMRIFHREWYVYIDVNHYFNGITKAFNMPFGWLTDACYSQLSV